MQDRFVSNMLQELPYRIFDNGNERVLLITHEREGVGVYEWAGLEPGIYEPHIHDEASSQINIMTGRGVIVIGEKEKPYEEGESFNVPAGVPHGFEVNEPTWLFTVLDQHILDPDTGEADFRYPQD